MTKERTGYVYEEKPRAKKPTAAKASKPAKKGKQAKPKTRWVARMTYSDAAGKRHNVKRYAETISDARDKLKDLLKKYDDRGAKALDGDKLTFNQLADKYKKAKLHPAQYHGGRKVSGVRSYDPALASLGVLLEHFGALRIKDIDHSDIQQFKTARLSTLIMPKLLKEKEVKEPKRRRKAKPNEGSNEEEPKPREPRMRTIAGVNRELELLRAILRFAYRQGWINRSPFDTGSSLISKADEVRRERVLTNDEEDRLLAACVDRREHLRPILIAALDTAMRRGELLKLKWSDVDLNEGVIVIRATTTKTLRERTIGITDRLKDELALLQAKSTGPDALVFGITDTFKNSFAAACKKAKVTGFRFHDCRHTAITRMVQSGTPGHLIMKISGHTQAVTFARYVNVDKQTARDAAQALTEFGKRGTKEKSDTEVIN